MSTFPATADLPQNGSIESRYLLDESTGNRVDIVGSTDLSATNMAAGTGYSNATSGVSYDNSADFESGDSGSLRNSDSGASVLSGNQDFTLAMWLNPESLPASNNQYQFANKWGNADAERCWDFDYRNDAGTPKLRFSNQDSATLNSVTISHTLSTGTWAHLVLVFDLSAGTLDMYKDGSQLGAQQSGLNTTVNTNANSDFTLGAIGDTPTQFYDGLQQDVIFWAGANLTSADVSDLYDLYTTAAAGGSDRLVRGVGI